MTDMNKDDFDRIAICYLRRDLQSHDFDLLKQHLEQNPDAAGRILELADQELLLSRGFGALPRISRIVRKSRRMLNRASDGPRKNLMSVGIGLSLAALLALCFFTAATMGWPKQDALRFIADLGTVSADTVLVRDGKILKGIAGTHLSSQDRIVTTDGHAAIEYADGTAVNLAGSTSVLLGEQDGGKRLMLATGSLDCSAARQSKRAPFVFSTPESESTVIGTKFKLSSASGTTLLQVDEGLVKLTDLATQESVRTGPGESVIADNHRKLTVTKMLLPTLAQAAEIDTCVEEFSDESTFDKGKLDLSDAPAGSPGCVREIPIKGSNPLFIMQSKFNSDKPHFAVHSDDVLHLTYRSERTGGYSEFELFLCLFPREGWASSCNVVCRVKPASTEWETADIPIASFKNLMDAKQNAEGMFCRSYFVQTFNYAGIKVGKFSVTREKGTK